MKAMLLCAGFGERLRPLTDEIPKPVFPVANRPVVFYTLRLLLSWGVDRVMINAHHLPEVLAAAARTCCPEGITLEFSFEEKILGTGGGLRNVRDWLGDDPFIVMNGDILTDMNIAEVVDFHVSSNAVATMVLSTDARIKALGEVEVDRAGRVRSIVGRPEGAGEGCVPAFFTGIHVMSRKVFDFIPDRPRSCIVRDCYSRMVCGEEGVFGFITGSYWKDVGTPRAYLEANFDVLDGAYMPPFALVSEEEAVSVPHPERPFLIGRGAGIGRDVRMGPYAVIGERAVIEDGCSIRESVVWPGARVPEESNLVRSIVGRTVSIEVT